MLLEWPDVDSPDSFFFLSDTIGKKTLNSFCNELSSSYKKVQV